MKLIVEDPTPHQPEESDELGKMFRIFLLATLLGGAAAFIASQQCGPERPDEPKIRINGSTVSTRSIGVGLAGAMLGLPVGAIVIGIALGEPGRGMLIGAFSGFLGAAIGCGCGEPVAGVIIGGLGAGIWSAVRLSG